MTMVTSTDWASAPSVFILKSLGFQSIHALLSLPCLLDHAEKNLQILSKSAAKTLKRHCVTKAQIELEQRSN